MKYKITDNGRNIKLKKNPPYYKIINQFLSIFPIHQ